ncbi:MAG: hypothetical protein OQJ97_17815 [Rhodospirillales bacterium]|nr:hypothetical protein [Rhodospirillales bacterium]
MTTNMSDQQDNTVELTDDAPSSISPENMAEMEKYGITRTLVDHFHHGEYRYATLSDALAQAKRVADKI